MTPLPFLHHLLAAPSSSIGSAAPAKIEFCAVLSTENNSVQFAINCIDQIWRKRDKSESTVTQSMKCSTPVPSPVNDADDNYSQAMTKLQQHIPHSVIQSVGITAVRGKQFCDAWNFVKFRGLARKITVDSALESPLKDSE